LPEGRRGHVAAFGGASGAEYRGTPTKLAGKYTSLGSSRCGGSAYISKYLPEGSWWFALKKKVNKYPVLEISYGNSSLGGWKSLFWQVFFGTNNMILKR